MIAHIKTTYHELKFKNNNINWKKKFVSVKKILKTVFIGNTRPRQMFNLYFYTLLVGTVLLMTPWATNKDQWKFLPALFTASSAFSDTGLTVKNTASDFTFFGQLIILILIKFGGIGLITVKLALLSLFMFNRNPSLKERLLMQGERGSNKLGTTMSVLKIAIIVMSVTELLGAIVLFLYFYFVPVTIPENLPVTSLPVNFDDNTYTNNVWLALWAGIFHSISAVNNAGFDIVGNNSLQPFQNDYFVQWIFIIEFVIGGIGFPVFYDLFNWIKARSHNKKFKFSLFTKITVTTYVIVAVSGVTSVLFIEYFSRNVITADGNPPLFKYLSAPDAIMAVIFNTMSTRNAGFYTVNLDQFHVASQIIQTLMMWIGSSPASTAGGIRTTTLTIIILTIISVMRGKRDVTAFKRKIPDQTVRMAFVVGTVGFILVFFGVMIIAIENILMHKNLATFPQMLYTTCSAFGTTGLTLLDNANLGAFSQLSLIFLMFIGQLGVSMTLLAWNDRKSKPMISRIEENVLIG